MIGGMEWILLIVIAALLLFGAKKIPEFARSLGKAKAEFQRGQMMVEHEIREEQKKYDDGDRKTASPKRKPSVIKAARALGINTVGKSEIQLKKEIAEQVA